MQMKALLLWKGGLFHPADHRIVPVRRCPPSGDFRRPLRKKGRILRKKPRRMSSQTTIYRQTTTWSPNTPDVRVQNASLLPTPDDGHKVPKAGSATVHL